MRKYNRKLNEDINQLKILHAKKDKTDFRKMKAVVMKQHDINKATVYREMKKENPGFYKTPRFNSLTRPVTDKEIRMVRELLVKGYTVQDIVITMEKATGESYNWDRINEIREAGEKESVKAEGETEFGDGIRNLLMKFFSVDKMADNSNIKLEAEGKVYILGRDMIKDVVKLISNSAVPEGDPASGVAVIEAAKIRMFHIIAERVRLISKGQFASINDLRDISNINQRKAGRAYFSFRQRQPICKLEAKKHA